MTPALDLSAYFERIQWNGGTDLTLATLTGLLIAHTARIPFEGLDVLLGRPVRLDLDSIQNKLVRARRGGYCFEHATLFAAVLEAIGFQPVRHAARVVMFEPRNEASRTHMFLTVPVDGARFIVDPGFGPFGSRIPVPLVERDNPHDEQATHWMVREDNLWALRFRRNDQPVTGWVTTLESENTVDFEIANHWIATHPNSLFMNWIILSTVTPEGRVNVMNRDVTILREQQETSLQLADRSALRALLVEHFGFDLPEVEQLKVPAIPQWQ